MPYVRGGYFDLDAVKAEVIRVEGEMAKPDFWNHPEEARMLSKRASELQKEVGEWEGLPKDLDELKELSELGEDDAAALARLE